MTAQSIPRMEKLLSRLKSRTDRHGEPLPGYKQNVAALRAEIAILTEAQENNDDGR